jgi:hypothetical protein
MGKDEIIKHIPEELVKNKVSKTDPIIKRDVMFGGQRVRLRSYRPEAMRELCNTCVRLYQCDHVLQPLPSKDGTSLCIEYSPDPSTRTCRFCGALNKLAVDNVRCHKCKMLLVVPGPFLRINKVKIDEEGNIHRILKKNIKE